MEQIQPSYATPEQAKKLKEKGFNVECRNYYLEKDKALYEGFEDEYWGDYRCINWNVDVIGIKPFRGFVSAPEQWQIVEWASLVHNIDIEARPVRYAGDTKTSHYSSYINGCIVNMSKFSTRKDALSEAINEFLKMI
jgi:hypothetical protein